MKDHDVELGLQKLFGAAPVVASPERLRQAVAGDRDLRVPESARVWRRPSGRAVPALAGLAATLVLAAALLTIVVGRPTPGASPSRSGPTPTGSAPIASKPPTPGHTPGKFVPTGSMTAGRDMAMATLLQDGRVLIAGGNVSPATTVGELSDAERSAELYDPKAGKFTATGSMADPRVGGSATLLRDGRVLVAGGMFNGPYASAELYDPKTGIFSPTGSMASARHFHTATLLADGRVLIAGGEIGADSGGSAAAELYDPGTGRFSPTGSMTAARDFATSTLLRDGRVLIAGGGIGVSSAEIYDPRTGTFSATGSMTITEASTATLLADGRVLINGIRTDASNMGFNESELYDPATGTFTATGSMINNCNCDDGATTAPLLADGRVLVPDLRFDASLQQIGAAELYNPVTGTFSETGPMSRYRSEFTDTLLADGRVLFAGDEDQNLNTLRSLSPKQRAQHEADRSSAELYTP